MPNQKSLIWDPVMVSMTKTKLTIRQNVKKKNKIKKFHFFLSWEKNEISESNFCLRFALLWAEFLS